MIKKFFRLLALVSLMLVCFAASASAADPVHGRVRIVGYKEDVPKPANKFAAYAIHENVDYLKGDYYLNFIYHKESSSERHWTLWVTDKDDNAESLPTGKIAVYLPYPSIWSKEQSAYWKWTEPYAKKHYNWEYARGHVITEYWSDDYQVTTYQREEYKPVPNDDMHDFGPCVLFTNYELNNSISVWIQFHQK